MTAIDPDADPGPGTPAVVDREPARPPAEPGPEPVRLAPPARRRRVPVIPIALTLVAVLAGSVLFISGYSMGRQAAADPGTPSADASAFQPFWDAYHTIEDRYAGGTVDRDTVIAGAIRGMITSLGDPFSAYLTPDEYKASLQGINGQFEGIGAEIGTRESDGKIGCTPLGAACHLVVTKPIPGSPAQKAGVLPDDAVLATDGVALDGLTVDGARDRIRGPKGSVVTLTIQRGTSRPFQLQVTRDVVQQSEVETQVLAGGTVGYIKLNNFSDASADDFVSALKADVDAGRTKLIIDLRGNPGGYVTAARKIASQFIASGPIFWEQDAQGRQLASDALTGGVATDPKIQAVVLVDGGSASASEIVSGALQDTKRATLVGQQTYGKGTVQQWQELTGTGGAFKLTVFRWLTPNKRWIHGTGLTPDVVVTLPAPVPAGTDPTLDRGLETLGSSARGQGLDLAA